MTVCVEKRPHSCGSRQALQIFYNPEEDNYTGYCFSCKEFIKDPYGEEKPEPPKEKTKEEIEELLKEIKSYPTVSIESRKLSKTSLEAMGVKTSLSEVDGETPTAMYFPMTKKGTVTGYYVKTLGKKSFVFSIGDVKKCDPFNIINCNGAHTLVITEGLPDAVAINQIFRKHSQNDDYFPDICSLRNGVNSVKSLANFSRKFKEYKKVVLAFDMDEPGQNAVKEALQIIPTAVVACLPSKDANDCILEGKTKAAYTAIAFNSSPAKTSRVLRGDNLYLLAREPTPPGELTWPFPSLNKLTRQIRFGETIYIGAGAKMGKSELLNHIAAHLMTHDNIPIFAAKPEEDIKKSYKMLAGKIVGKVFHDPEKDFDYDAFDKASKVLNDKLYLLDMYQHLGWDSLRQDIVHAANQGCKAVFIDPITNLTNGVSAAETNTVLQQIAQELSAMAKDMQFTAFMFCHLKAPEGNIARETREKMYREGKFMAMGNCPHELGGSIYSSQFTGSRAMMRSCNLMLGLEGNKDPELDEIKRNTRQLKILEDREFGNSSIIPLYWNPNTTLFNEA